MKNLNEFIYNSINEEFNKTEHEEIKNTFIKSVGNYWDEFIKYILSKCKKKTWNEYCDKTGSCNLWNYLLDEKNIEPEDIAKKIKCNPNKLYKFMDSFNEDLSFTIDEFIQYNKTI